MKHIYVILIQILILKYVYSGLTKNIFGTVTEEIHKVKEDIQSSVSKYDDFERKGIENIFNNTLDSFKETVGSVNESVNDMFSTKEQSDSNEAYKHSSKETSSWSRHTYQTTDNTLLTEENPSYLNFHNHHNHNHKEYSATEDKYTDSSFEHSNHKTAVNYNDNFQNNDKKVEDSKHNTQPVYNSGKSTDNVATTSKTYDTHSNASSPAFYDSNDANIIINESENVTSVQISGSNSGVIVTYDNNSSNVDHIVFPGKTDYSTERTQCSEGLVITANGGCLEPIIIHMGNSSRNDSKIQGVTQSVFVGGCMPGYDRTVDGQCAETMYD